MANVSFQFVFDNADFVIDDWELALQVSDFVEVVDPPWNVTQILLTRSANKATVLQEELPHMVGTLLYDWHEGIYNGANYSYLGGNVITGIDGLTIDADTIFDACYTIVEQNPFTTITSRLIVKNLAELFALICTDTDLQETAELLAAFLGPQGIGLTKPADLCSEVQLATTLCGQVETTTALCGSIGYE